MHHMQVDLEVAYPSLEIVDAQVIFDAHPHATCPDIVEHYRNLIGIRSPAASPIASASCSADPRVHAHDGAAACHGARRHPVHVVDPRRGAVPW